MTSTSTSPRLAVSAKEAAWAPFQAREVAPIVLTVSNAGGGKLEWRVASSPWWLRAVPDGDRLVLRLAHYGRLEGTIGLASNGGRQKIRVSSGVQPPFLGAMVGVVRTGAGGLLSAILASALLVGTFPLVYHDGPGAGWEESAMIGLPIIAVTLLAASWGWVLGGPRLGLRAALGMIASCSLLLAMIGLAAGAAAIFPRLQDLSPVSKAAALLPSVVLLPAACFGMVLGGRRIALASAWRLTLAGVGMSAPFVLYPFLGLLVMFVQMLLLGGALAWLGLTLAPLADKADQGASKRSGL